MKILQTRNNRSPKRAHRPSNKATSAAFNNRMLLKRKNTNPWRKNSQNKMNRKPTKTSKQNQMLKSPKKKNTSNLRPNRNKLHKNFSGKRFLNWPRRSIRSSLHTLLNVWSAVSISNRTTIYGIAASVSSRSTWNAPKNGFLIIIKTKRNRQILCGPAQNAVIITASPCRIIIAFADLFANPTLILIMCPIHAGIVVRKNSPVAIRVFFPAILDLVLLVRSNWSIYPAFVDKTKAPLLVLINKTNLNAI